MDSVVGNKVPGLGLVGSNHDGDGGRHGSGGAERESVIVNSIEGGGNDFGVQLGSPPSTSLDEDQNMELEAIPCPSSFAERPFRRFRILDAAMMKKIDDHVSFSDGKNIGLEEEVTEKFNRTNESNALRLQSEVNQPSEPGNVYGVLEIIAVSQTSTFAEPNGHDFSLHAPSCSDPIHHYCIQEGVAIRLSKESEQDDGNKSRRVGGTEGQEESVIAEPVDAGNVSARIEMGSPTNTVEGGGGGSEEMELEASPCSSSLTGNPQRILNPIGANKNVIDHMSSLSARMEALEAAEKHKKNESNTISALKLQIETLTNSVQNQIQFLLGKVQTNEEEVASKTSKIDGLNVQVLKLTQTVEDLKSQNQNLTEKIEHLQQRDLGEEQSMSNADQSEPQREELSESVSSQHDEAKASVGPADYRKTLNEKAKSKRDNVVQNGKKKHVCNLCEKRFARMEHLQSHLRTHTGERPFKCMQCKRTFACPSNKRRHQKFHCGPR